MGVFGFIENFFFISLALVFVLVVFLVYHFKNRISVAEKKSESMYGLITAVVKEIKVLRGMFGLGTNDPNQNQQLPPQQQQQTPVLANPVEVKSKTEPEVNVSVSHKPLTKEVITLDFAASDKKIVVSDASSDEDESTVSSDDDESSVSSSDEDDDSSVSSEEGEEPQSTNNLPEVVVLEVLDTENKREETEIVIPATEPESVDPEFIQLEFQNMNIDEMVPEPEQPTESVAEPVQEQDLVEPEQTKSGEDVAVPSIEQLRKMNINQLKTIASQVGITADVSKMKKPELISLITLH